MTIQQNDDGWIGTSAQDIRPYLLAVTAAGYPVGRTVEAACSCGESRFTALIDADEGVAQLTCAECSKKIFIEDSEDFWEEAEPEALRCRCGGRVFDAAVGYSFLNAEAKAWITVGVRCVDCGLLFAPIDWADDRADGERP